MSRQRSASEWLPVMAAEFPNTFFADPKQVQPLKIDIHLDLLPILPEGIKSYQAKSFLYWYVSRAAYQRALLHGQGRIDLSGTLVDSVIPDAIREQARERWLQLQQDMKARKAGKPRPARPGQPRPAASLSPLDLEELYSMAIDAKLELTLKFSTLPNAKPASSGKMAFALKTSSGEFVTVEVNNKSWRKLSEAAAAWPSWIAALSGTMGARAEKGFALANPGLQVFEKKVKVADTAPAEAAPTACVPTPASPAEPVTPPPPAVPITVTIKTGTATVTKRAPLSLKR